MPFHLYLKVFKHELLLKKDSGLLGDEKIIAKLVDDNWNKVTKDIMTETALEKLLKNIGLAYLTQNNRITQIFNEIDTNKDRIISKEELVD